MAKPAPDSTTTTISKMPRAKLLAWADPANITITRTSYALMLANCKLLSALEAAGVDNWEGYGEAFSAVGVYEEDD